MFQFASTRPLLLMTLLFSVLSYANAQHGAEKAIKSEKPSLQLATKYQKYSAIENYWLSEKLDGVRGYWTGKQLLTRSGNLLSPPRWFIEGWPNIAMDGELWSARGEFEQISACIRRKNSDGGCWKNLKLMLFDLPDQTGDFSQRITIMQQLIQETSSAHLAMIPQKKLTSNADLYALLEQVVQQNAEGLMLHLASGHYQPGRSKNLLKLKKFQDAEARVIAHLPGKGKYQGLLGAIKVQTPDGVIFKIGSGFSDLQRQQPPKIGSIITYKYTGKTQRGVPRFASFLRIKNEH